MPAANPEAVRAGAAERVENPSGAATWTRSTRQ